MGRMGCGETCDSIMDFSPYTPLMCQKERGVVIYPNSIVLEWMNGGKEHWMERYLRINFDTFLCSFPLMLHILSNF